MARAPETAIQASPGRIVLSDSSHFAADSWSSSKSLLGRILALPVVRYVQVDRARGSTDILLDLHFVDSDDVAVMLREFSRLLRSAETEVQVHDSYRYCEKFSFIKLENSAVAGEIRWMQSGETCLVHPLLKGKCGLNSVVKSMLEWQPQISKVTILPDSKSVLIQHESELKPDQLLVLLEHVLGKVADAAYVDDSKRQLVASTACLALAIPAEFMLTGMVPFVAAALVVANLPVLGRGMIQLMTMRWRLPALYTVIMGTTLISGQVLAAALMQVSIAGWYCWSNRRLRLLIEGLLHQLEMDSNLRTVPIEAAPSLPALPHHPIADTFDPAMIESSGSSEPVQECLMKSLARVSSSRLATERCQDQASKFIPFTFATGVAAIATADISTLAAVLRPDFSTGPSISEQISIISVMRELLQKGWLVTRHEALARFVSADQIILFQPDDSSELKDSQNSNRPADENVVITNEFWDLPETRVTIQVKKVIATSAACSAYAQRLAKSEKDVVLCGPSDLIHPQRGSSAVWIATDSQQYAFANVQADLVAITESSSLMNLFDSILSGTLNMRNGWSIVLTCNIASVLGAFVVGLTSLHVVALTNLGTWAAFSAMSRSTRQKETQNPAIGNDGQFEESRANGSIHAKNSTLIN